MKTFEFSFYNPVRVVFGAGKLDSLGEETAKIGKVALIVSYANFGGIKPTLDRAAKSLEAAGVRVVKFFEFEQNPDISTVAKGRDVAIAEKCDVVVGIGGGSAMDAAKAVAAAVYYEGDLWNMVAHSHSRVADIKPPEKALPIVCVPTLPATGSEMNMCSVLSNRALGCKSYIWAECLFAKLALQDPELTYSVPPKLTALACVDAISHVLEIYINSRDGTPLQSYFQESVMRVCMENLFAAIENPSDEFARANLMWAAACAINGWAYPGDGWTPVHQVGHVLTSKFGVAHGASISCLLPAWMRYNSKRRPNVYANFARNVMGVPKGLPEEAAISGGIDAFEAFLMRAGVPVSLADLNISPEHFDAIVDGVRAVSFNSDGVLACNPTMTAADIKNVLTNSYERK